MRQVVAASLVLVSLLTMGLSGCASVPTPSPFPVLGPLQAGEKAQILQARTTGIRTLAAVLAMSLSGPEQHRTFDLVVNYDHTGKLRFTALKDVGLSSQPIFDLLFAEERYHLELHDETGLRQSQGWAAQFAQEHPQFSAFVVVGEAFFLPGFDGRGHAPVFTNTAATCFTTRLRSGAKARWVARPETLEITQARIAGAGPVSFSIQYGDYRRVEAYYLPGRVTFRARRLGVTTETQLKQVEINMPLAPGIFDLPAAHQKPS